MIPSFFVKPLIYLGCVAVAVLVFLGWLHMHDAAIRKECEVEKTMMVSKASYDALKATQERTQRNLDATVLAYSEATKRATEAEKAKNDALQQLDELMATASQDETLKKPSESELQWLGRH